MREVSTSLRAGFEAPASADVPLIFLTIGHPNLSDDIRVVGDVRDFVRDGKLYQHAPFEIELLTDDERPPRGKLSIQNVDRQIGEAVRLIGTAPTAKIELLSSVDFDLTQDPRVALGTPVIEYEAAYLRLRNIAVDALQVTADIMSFDYSQEPWPAIRATKSRLPGLFR